MHEKKIKQEMINYNENEDVPTDFDELLAKTRESTAEKNPRSLQFDQGYNEASMKSNLNVIALIFTWILSIILM